MRETGRDLLMRTVIRRKFVNKQNYNKKYRQINDAELQKRP